jgi:hypothetical protein
MRLMAGLISQRLFVVLSCLLFMAAAAPAQAQDDEPGLILRLRRDFGYGAGARMQGRFSYRVTGPDDLERVEFLMDDVMIGGVTEPPFNFQFQTEQFEIGPHQMSAIGYTAGGELLMSNTIGGQFVSGQSAGLSTGIVVGGILLLVIAFRIASHLVTRQKSGPGYGMLGGTVCPNCGRPFARHWWAFNMLAVRLDRCPHCKKWVSTTRATAEQLAAAETFARELDEEGGQPVLDPARHEDALRQNLDDSRYV